MRDKAAGLAGPLPQHNLSSAWRQLENDQRVSGRNRHHLIWRSMRRLCYALLLVSYGAAASSVCAQVGFENADQGHDSNINRQD